MPRQKKASHDRASSFAPEERSPKLAPVVVPREWVELVAYYKWLQSGSLPGQEEGHWLEAEKELQSQLDFLAVNAFSAAETCEIKLQQLPAEQAIPAMYRMLQSLK